MAILVNRSARLYIIGGKAAIPGRPLEVGDIDALCGKYPEVRQLIDAGEMETVSPAKAKEIKQTLDDMEVAELKAYADKNGVDIGKAKKKGEILKILRAAGK